MFAPEMALLHQWGRFSLVQGELNPPSCCILYQREPSPLVHEALVFRGVSTSSGLRPASELARCHSRGSHATGAFCAFGFVPPVTKAGFSEFFRTNVKGYRAPSARPFPSQPSYRVSAAIAPPRADPLRGSLRSRAADSEALRFPARQFRCLVFPAGGRSPPLLYPSCVACEFISQILPKLRQSFDFSRKRPKTAKFFYQTS